MIYERCHLTCFLVMTPPKSSVEGLPVSARSENMRATSGRLVYYVISGSLASVFDR